MAGTPETALLNTGADAMAAAIGQASIHSADPAGSGGSQTSSAKVACGFTNTGGVFDLDAPVAFTGAANAGATHVAFWTADGVTLLYSGPLTGDQTFNAAGEYSLDTYVITLADGD